MQEPKQVQQNQPLIPKQKNNDCNNTLSKIWKNTLSNYPTYKIGDAFGTLHATKKDMDNHNLINGDNYYHRLGMCLNAQKGFEVDAVELLEHNIEIFKKREERNSNHSKANEPENIEHGNTDCLQ